MCQDFLGPVKHQHKEWISFETLANIPEKKKQWSTTAALEQRKPRDKGKTQRLTKLSRRVLRQIKQLHGRNSRRN
jgi:hypothetical protein